MNIYPTVIVAVDDTWYVNLPMKNSMADSYEGMPVKEVRLVTYLFCICYLRSSFWSITIDKGDRTDPETEYRIYNIWAAVGTGSVDDGSYEKYISPSVFMPTLGT